MLLPCPTRNFIPCCLGKKNRVTSSARVRVANHQLYFVAEKCSQPSEWKTVNGELPFCNSHKQQMSFMKFERLETKKITVAHCSANPTHGLATMYCKKCKKALCSNCTLKNGHVSHGAIGVDEALQEWGNQLDSALQKKKLQYEQAAHLKKKAKDQMKLGEKVCW